MSRGNDNTVQTAMIFFGLFVKLLAMLGSFFLWLFRHSREKKRKELEAIAEPNTEDLTKQEMLKEIQFHLDNDLENNDLNLVEYDVSGK